MVRKECFVQVIWSLLFKLGTPTMEPFCIKTITEEIEYEKNRILELQHTIQEKQKKNNIN